MSDPAFREEVQQMSELIEEFRQVAALAGARFPDGALAVESQPAPHEPPSPLPKGKMAVYAFSWNEQCLKVGKVGPKSQARYTHQHYLPKSSKSNLAKSILAARDELGILAVSELDVGAWIKANIDRTNFLLDERCGIATLALLEAFLQCRLRPRFEGFKSQHR